MNSNSSELPLPLSLDGSKDHIPPLYCRINDWGLLQVQGNDAEKFLQGQVTCDMRRLKDEGQLSGAFCNPKGRVLATFQLFTADQAVYLRMPRDLISHIQSYLKRYAVFFDVQLHYVHQLVGLAVFGGPDLAIAEMSLHGHIHHADADEYWGTEEKIQKLEQLLAPSLTQGQPEWWDAHLIQNGIAQVASLTSEHFLAHQLSLDLSGAVSFRKGCYTGQEIVARTQYRGKSKRRLRAARVHHRENFYPGTEIIGLEGGPLGHLLLSVSDSAGTLIQAVLPDDLSPRGEFILGNHKTPYELLRLPFQEETQA